MTYGRTHRGLVRPNNEDGYLMRALAPGAYVVAVADGIGGGPAGQEASRIALETLDDAVGHEASQLQRLVAAVSLANRAVYQASVGHDDLYGMGTTLTSAVLNMGHLFLAHVGDSRAYRVLDTALERLTMDHSVAGELEQAGGLTPDEARHHPRRNVLTRWIGSPDKVHIDAAEMPWHAGDRLLLCTDGLTSVLSEGEIMARCLRHRGRALVDELIRAALTHGGPDNITVVLAEGPGEPGDSDGR